MEGYEIVPSYGAADVVVVNHHLFFADLAIKLEADGARRHLLTQGIGPRRVPLAEKAQVDGKAVGRL